MRISDIMLLLMSSVAVGTDLCDGKIYQKWLGAWMLADLLSLLVQRAYYMLPGRILGTVIPFGVLFLFFAAGALGGGDVKLFCAIGFFVGGWGSLHCLFAACVTGVIYGFGRMFLKGVLKDSMRRLAVYGRAIFLHRRLLPVETEPEGGDLLRMSGPAMVSVWLYLEGLI